MWEVLFDNIQNLGVWLDAAESALLQESFSVKKLRKNQYLVQQGDVVRYENFIVKGITRTYTIDDKGSAHIIALSPEGWWVGDLYSFFTGNPTNYHIDCLEETTVLQITRGGLENLCLKVPKLNIYYRDLYRNAVIANNKRLQSTLEKTALERYLEFREKYPAIEQRVPNHQIAAFLGITPQSLSRIRNAAVQSKLT